MTTAQPSRTSVGISFATQYLELAIQFVAVMVLARMLTPAETGSYTIAAFLMTLLHVFRDFGVVQYVIQARELSRENIQNAMGVAILLALLVAGVLLSVSGLVADFYGNPDIKRILWVMSASFAISPFGSVLLAIMRREGRLETIFYIRMASALCHVAVSLTLAWMGFGALSLAWANFGGILAFGVAANILRPPGIPYGPRFSQMRSILSFGGIASLGNAVNMAGTNLPDMVIGKVMSMSAVGYFSRANGLVQLFSRLISGALTPLVLPYFAHLRRIGQDLKPGYLLAVEQLTAVSWPFFTGLALLTYPMVHALYGTQWDESVPVVRLLCVAGAIASVSLFSSQAMVANGQVGNSTRSILVAQPVRIIAVLVASTYDLKAVGLAIIAAECVALGVTSRALYYSIGLTMMDLLRACKRSLLITLASAIVPLLVFLFWPDYQAPWPPLMIGIAGAAIGWGGSIIALRHPLSEHLTGVLAQVLSKLGLGSGGLRMQAKNLVFKLGLLTRYHRWRNRRHLTVTMFHRVLPRHDPRFAGADPEWTMTPEAFSASLAFFRRHYSVVTPQQVFDALRGGQPLPDHALLITFDDGWADTAEFAQPLLDQAGMQALVFVVGDVVGRDTPFWEEHLYALLSSDPAGWLKLEQRLRDCGMAPLDNGKPAIFNTEPAIRAAIAELSKRDRAQVLDMVTGLALDGLPSAMLAPQQLAGLASAGHAIGGHGYCHQPLTRVPDLPQEVRQAQAALAQLLQRPVIESMSFPHGAFNDDVIGHCRAVGYRYLFNSEPYLNQLSPAQAGDSAVLLHRIHISERAITDGAGRLVPSEMATYLFLRQAKPARTIS